MNDGKRLNFTHFIRSIRWFPPFLVSSALIASATMLATLLVLFGCDGKKIIKPIGPKVDRFMDSSGRSIRDTDNDSIPDLPSEARPTIISAFTGFTPGQIVELQVFKDNIAQFEEPLLLTADANGNLPPLPILWDIGVDPNTGQLVDVSGTYEIVAFGEGKRLSFSFEITPPRMWGGFGLGRQAFPVGWIWILAGTTPRSPMGSVQLGEPIWVEGMGFNPNQRIKVFIVKDKDNWQDGDQLTDESGGVEEIQTDTNGALPRTQIWASAQRTGTGQTGGDYDVIVDVNRNDKFDIATDIANASIGTGFTVQVPPSPPILAQLAASTQGRFKDEFYFNEIVGVWVNPPNRPLTPYRRVAKYIVLHKSSWQDGDVLIDVTGRPEWDIMRFA